MTIFEESMAYERAYGEIKRILLSVGQKINVLVANNADERDIAHLRILTEEFGNLARKYRKKSDELFEQYKASNPPESQIGFENLANAIIKQACDDYEIALCNGYRKTLEEVREFARENSPHGMYSSVDMVYLLQRIEKARKMFNRKVEENAADIYRVTGELKKRGAKMYLKDNPHRCPMCGGGLYSGKKRGNTFTVSCTGCYLTRSITINKENNN